MNARRNTSGFSVLEMAIATSLLGIVVTGVMMMCTSTNRAYRSTLTDGDLDAAVRRALDRIAETVAPSRRGSVTPAAPGAESPFNTRQIDFQTVTGFGGGAPIWGATQRIAFQYSPTDPDDGADNDANGMVDDGRVIWTTNLGQASQRTYILALGVTEFADGETLNGADQNGNGLIDERGLSFDFHANSVTVRLTLQRTGDRGQIFTRSDQRTVAFHNL